MIEELLTRKETAKILRVSKAFLDSWTEKGKIPKVQMGRRVLYRKDDLEQIIKKGGLVEK